MSTLSKQTGALLVAGLTLLAGCKRDTDNKQAEAAAPPPVPHTALTALGSRPPPVALEELSAPHVAAHTPLAIDLTPPPIRSTNSTEYARTKFHLDAFERWLTSVDGSAVASKATRRTPENDRAIKSLQHLLNDYNSLVPALHPGEKSWTPLKPTGVFRDNQTEAMVKRTERLLTLVSSGKAGREFFFALRDALEEAYGATPRLHKVLKASVLAENESLTKSPNLKALERYPAIKAFCFERNRRLIEPPSVSASHAKDVQLVKEVQHCLIKLGYDFEIKKLQQTGVRDNVTDEALKLFSRHFLRETGPLRVDQNLIYKLANVATGFDFLLGATLNSEYNGVPYSKDPYKSYCGLTAETLEGWCKKRALRPPPLFDIRESTLRACFREEFILASGCEHLLAMSAGAQRVKALEAARLVADESYNRSPARALRTVAYALGTPTAEPTKETMEHLLAQSEVTVPRLVYGRAFAVGFNGGGYQAGLTARLNNATNFIVSLSPALTQRYVATGISAGSQERVRVERAKEKTVSTHKEGQQEHKAKPSGKSSSKKVAEAKTTRRRT